MKIEKVFAWFLLAAAVILLINAGSYGVVESSDARYAEIAREMYVSGDYLHPNLLNVHHYHKPPVTYQITALGYRLFGINAFGARFFLQIAVLFQLLLVYRLAMLLFNEKRTALAASMIYFSFPIVLISSRNLTTDAFLTTFVLAAMVCWVMYRKNGVYYALLLFYLSLALGFLTKGPVVFMVTLPFVWAYNYREKPKKRFGAMHILALLLFIAAASSWYLYLIYYDYNFLNYFIGKQTVDRVASNTFNRHEPFWYFWLIFPAVILPWSLVLPKLPMGKGGPFRKNSLCTILAVAIIVPVILFTLSSSKRVLYILPLFGLTGVLLSRLLMDLPREKVKTVVRIIYVFAALIIGLAISALFIKSDFNISYGIGVGGALAAGLIAAVAKSSVTEPRFKAVFSAAILAGFLTVGGSKIMADNQLEIKSAKPIADFIKEKGLAGREILVYNTRKPSIAFELNKPIISLYDGSRGLERETLFEQDTDWKNYLINMNEKEEIATLKNYLAAPTVLIAYKHALPERLSWLKNEYEHLEQMGKWYVYY